MSNLKPTLTSLFKAVSGDAKREHEKQMLEMQLEHETRKLDRHERQQADAKNEVLMAQPRMGIMQVAQAVMDGKKQADLSVLSALEVKGVGRHFKTVALKCPKDQVRDLCLNALQQLPAATKEAIADSVMRASEIMEARKEFVFKGGEGQYNCSIIRRQEAVNGSDEVAFAVLVYGMSFNCADVVEHFEEIEEEEPVYEDRTKEVLDSSSSTEDGWFTKGKSTQKYKTVTDKVFVRTRKVTKKIPVFKEAILSAEKVHKVFEALERQASEDALKTLKA